MCRKLVKIGNSQALLLSEEMLGLLEVLEGGEVEVQVLSNVLLLGSAELSGDELRMALTFATSLKEDAELYCRLA